MCRFVHNLAVLLVLALPLEAAEHSWSFTPVVPSSELTHEVVLTDDPDVVYSQNFGHLQRSDDGGRVWSHVEAPPGTSPLAVDPRDPNVLFRFYYERLMRSSDGGTSWVPVLNLSPYDSAKVLVSRHFPGRVYAISQLAIWQSRDGGATFSMSADLPGREHGNTVELTEAADGGLYLRRQNSCSRHCVRSWRIDRSTDQGQTWTNLFLDETGVNRILQALPHPTRPEVVYFVRDIDFDSHLLYSEDRGTSVVDRGEMPGFGLLHTDDNHPDSLLQVGAITLHRSADRGVSWQEMPVPRAGLTEGTLAANLAGRLIFYGLRINNSVPAGPKNYVSGDAGATWSPLEVTSYAPVSIHEMVISGPEGVLYASTGAGTLHRSTDEGATWQTLPAPNVFGALTGDPADGNTVYLLGYVSPNTQIWRSQDGGNTFVGLGDLGPLHEMVAVRQGEATHLVVTLRNGNLARSPDGGTSWYIAAPVVVPNPGFVQFERLEVSGSSVYSMSGGILYGSEDGGATWTRRGQGGDLFAAGHTQLAILDIANNRIGTSVDGGFSYSFSNLPFLADVNTYSRSDLEIDGHGTIYLLGPSKLLRSSDGGRTWQTLSQGLPERSAEGIILADPSFSGQLYWAGDAGFYRGLFPDNWRLPLLRGRFEARLRYRVASHHEWRDGSAIVTSDQSGLFRLFPSDRAEVAVQMLDGRAQGGRFWVFVASMTDVEIEVEILDRVEGEVWRHHQPLGEIRSTADLSAFPRQPELISGALPLPFGGLFEPQPVITLNDQFDVSVSWIANGEINVAHGRRLLGETAAFTFFDGSAIDVLVNVIDGRSINGKYWVFGGSLTDVQFVVTIKNRATGAIKTIHNPPGAFAGFSDSQAF